MQRFASRSDSRCYRMACVTCVCQPSNTEFGQRFCCALATNVTFWLYAVDVVRHSIFTVLLATVTSQHHADRSVLDS